MGDHLSYEGHTYGKNNGGWFNLTQQQNPFSKLNYGSTIGALGSVAGQLGNSLISNGYSDGVGSGIANIGGTLGGAISTVNPLVGGIVSAASGIVGGLTNRAFGTKENKANISAITQNTQNMNLLGNQIAGAGDSGSFFKLAGNMGTSSGFSSEDLVKGGWFSGGKARRKAQKYLNAENNALAFQNHGMALGALGVDQNQDDSTLAHFSAYGGPLNMINNDNMGAIEYGFMSDWLANKRAKEDRLKDNANSLIGEPLSTLFADGGKIEIKHPGRLTALKKRTGKTEAELWAEGKPEVRKMITFARNSRKWKKAYGGYLDSVGKLNDTLFALGGDLQSHGSDWSNGASYIGAGLSHEMNPNGGVQVGVDSQGTPNLVEQDEVIYDDYVYSNRIPIGAATKEKFHIGKKKDMTYADLARKLGKEIEERPNDPISKAGYRSQMLALQEEQERQKQEMEAERAREAFASLSPEEQTAVMQQVAQQEQMVQEQAMAEQQAMQQSAPEDIAMAQQQADGSVANLGQEVPMMAEGGKIYKSGGNFEDWWNLYIDDPAKKANIRDTINGVDMKKIYEAITGEKAPAVENIYLYDALKDLYNTDDTQFRPFDLNTYTMEKEAVPTRAEVAAANTVQTEAKNKEESGPIKMRNSATSKLRYIPAVGGAIGLGYDLLSRPDYSRADAIINASSDVTPTMIQPSYLGDYLTYRPMDIWAEQNRMDASARATDRAIRNSNSPSRMAGLLSSGYNSLLADGELYKKALEYNDALREKTAAFNRGTNQYNSQVNMTAQQANQNAAMAARRYGLQGIITGNQMKEAIDAQRGANISANFSNLLQSIGNIGEEAYDKDRLQYLIDSGVLHGQLHKKYGGMLTKKSKKGGKC